MYKFINSRLKSYKAFTIFTVFTALLIAGCGSVGSGSNRSSGSSLTLVSVSSDTLGFIGGGNDQTTVVFSVRDSNDDPVENASVNFGVNDPAGIGITLSRSSGSTNASGEVSVVATSSTFSGVFAVTASTTASTIQSTDIVVLAGSPVQGRIAVGMNRNQPDTFNIVGADIPINVILSDVFGNPVQDGTQVRFISDECGLVEPSCSTTNGECSATWSSTGSSPRASDFRCTILVYTNGLEDFSDDNSNGVFDAGEAFTDLGEAFADNNENNLYDIGEFFEDSVTNGLHTPGDGQYTSNGVVIFTNQFFVLSVSAVGTPTFSITPGTTIDVSGGEQNLTVTLPDTLGNSLPGGTTIVFTTANGQISGDTNVTIPDTFINPITVSITIRADGTASLGDLTLTVEPTGDNPTNSNFTWPIQD